MHDAGALRVEQLPGALHGAASIDARSRPIAGPTAGQQAFGQLDDDAVGRQRFERQPRKPGATARDSLPLFDTGSRTNGSGEGRPRSARTASDMRAGST